MRLDVDGLNVEFPYSRIYPEQHRLMRELKATLDANGQHALLEVPACIGRTVALLALYVAYWQAHPEVGKLVFACRTVCEIGKVLEILRLVVGPSNTVTGTGLPSRSMLEAATNARREAGLEDVAGDDEPLLQPGVNSLDAVTEVGARRHWGATCLAMRLVADADVVVCNYNHLLDPKVSQLLLDAVSPLGSGPDASASRAGVLIFDEAHNLDHACVEVLSLNFRLPTLARCRTALERLDHAVRQLDPTALGRDCDALASTPLRTLLNRATAVSERPYVGSLAGVELFGAPPTIMLGNGGESGESIEGGEGEGGGGGVVPGNLRKPTAFVRYLQRFVAYLHSRLESCTIATLEPPRVFLHDLEKTEEDFSCSLRSVAARLRLLLASLELDSPADFCALCVVADFATLVSTHQNGGFGVSITPRDVGAPATQREPLLQLCCHDASIALRPLLARARSVVLTSGTLSPLDLWQTLLGLQEARVCSLDISFPREALRPFVIARGADQVAMRSAGAGDVTDPGVVRNYGKLLLECAASVPDGVVVFFASFALMQSVLATWSKTDSKNGQIDLLNGVTRHKLLFIESTDPAETAVALDHYKRACDVGRGAVFLGIARSKVAEAVEFDGHYGRAVIVLGFPFLDLRSRAAVARLEWLRDARGISEAEYLGMEAIRQAAQVIGQVVRGKTDYGVLLLVDRRYAEPKRRAHLPRWIAQFMERGDRRNLSTDVAVRLTKEYLREMPMEQVASVKESYAGACGWVGTGDAIAPAPEWHQSGARVVPMEIG